ncbi:membrane bound O-acyl transferase family-domain-containing protein [Trichophaea hybrida]|nr:membrane bound O-acyl transferase family-domain-containing protein [Trichophaea hybrida]
MNFGQLDGPESARLYELQRSLPTVIRFTSTPEVDLASRPPLRLLPVLFYYALLFIPFLIPPFPFRRFLFLSVQTALFFQILRCTTGYGQGHDFVVMIIMFGQLQRFHDFYGCAGPPEENPELTCSKNQALSKNGANTRGIGWGWQMRTRPELGAPTTRWRFVARNALKTLALVIAMIPLHKFYPNAEQVLNSSWPERIVSSNICIFIIYSFIDGAYCASAAFMVALHLSEPEDWPPAYGKITSCYSIRRAWAFWHQMLTRTIFSHTNYLCKLLGLSPDKKSAWLLRVYVAFFLSGVLHSVPVWAISRTDGANMLFFMAQAVGITIEEVVWRPLGRNLGIARPENKYREVDEGKRWIGITLGWVWTAIWFSLMNVVFVEGLVAAGMKPLVDFRGFMVRNSW